MRNFALLLLAALPIIGNSQVIKWRTTVYFRNGHTEDGWINFKEWDDDDPPTKIAFYRDSLGEAISLTPPEINHIEVKGLERYVSMPFEFGCIQVSDVARSQEHQYKRLIQDTVFGRALVWGKSYCMIVYGHNGHRHYVVLWRENNVFIKALTYAINNENMHHEGEWFDYYRDVFERDMSKLIVEGKFDEGTRKYLFYLLHRKPIGDFLDLARFIYEMNDGKADGIGIGIKREESKFPVFSAFIMSNAGYSKLTMAEYNNPQTEGIIAGVRTGGQIFLGGEGFRSAPFIREEVGIVYYSYKNGLQYVSRDLATSVGFCFKRPNQDGYYLSANVHVFKDYFGQKAKEILSKNNADFYIDGTWWQVTWRIGIMSHKRWEFALEGVLYGDITQGSYKYNPVNFSLYVGRHIDFSKVFDFLK